MLEIRMNVSINSFGVDSWTFMDRCEPYEKEQIYFEVFATNYLNTKFPPMANSTDKFD
jgi:hypothetical protein